MNKMVMDAASKGRRSVSEGRTRQGAGKTILTLSLILFLCLLAFGCAGASEMSDASEETAAEAPPEEPVESEPVVEMTMAPQPEAPAEEPELPAEESDEEPAEEEPVEAEPVEPPADVIPEPVVASRFPERRLLTLVKPRRIWVGDSDVVRIVLEVDEGGNITPTAFFEENEIQVQTVEIMNLYDTHIIRAEARLEMAGVEVVPAGSIERRLNPGETVEFSWSVVPDQTGTYRGNVWVFLRYIPKEEGEILEKTLFSQLIEFQSVNLLGMGGSSARWLGAVGSLITSLLGLDDIFKWLRRGRKGKAKVA